ncbi:hypothetical protein OUZ56_032844 [Daphnia magna]|uniref:Uncharacterized protein n=1 Tax=Daphnia magna TaxID=35525 RepID=A0ABR0B9P7_9CRUS|nr:hypothetical protein OUZ56_032844 [Daphnia magna]
MGGKGKTWGRMVWLSRYPGYARFRDLYSQHLARLLWWLESGEDIFYPTSRSAVFLPECLLEEFEDFV